MLAAIFQPVDVKVLSILVGLALVAFEERRAFFWRKVFVHSGKQFNDFCEYPVSIVVNQTRDHLVRNILCARAKHFLQLRSAEPLNYHIFIRFFSRKFFQKIHLIVCILLWVLLQ